jgi:hypothetical protein
MNESRVKGGEGKKEEGREEVTGGRGKGKVTGKREEAERGT